MLASSVSRALPLVPIGRRFKSYDVVVVGGGPGGYVAALKGAQAGLKVACVESRSTLGGTCLNVGCIPTKAMLQSTHMLHEAKTGQARHGFSAKDVAADYKKMTGSRDKTVGALTKGIEFLFKNAKVDYVKGKASFKSATSLSVAGSSETLDAKDVILATGSVPAPMPGDFLKIDGKKVITSDGLLKLATVPKKMLIIGGGAIGLECATILARLGTKVEIIEFMPQVAVGFDKDVSDVLVKVLKKEGVTIHLNTKVTGADTTGAGVKLTGEGKGGKAVAFDGDCVLVAVGRRPYTEGLGLESVGIKTDRGRVVVDEYLATNVPHVRAIGDLVSGPMLAHKAEEDGVCAINNILGHREKVDYSHVPGVIYTHPEAAVVGRTEDDLKKGKVAYKKGFFGLAANSRARANQETDGFVKVLADKTTDKILGAAIVAPGAGDLIQQFVLAVKFGLTSKQIADTIHAHPTLSEACKEASLHAAYGKALHC